MTETKTNYLGLALKNPFVASSSPLTDGVDRVKQLENAGVAAVILPSLFEEQIIQESLKIQADLERGTGMYAEALDYFPDHGQYSIGPEKYLEKLQAARQAVSIPVLGSLNGVTSGGWTEYAKRIEEAGADALELNLYDITTDPSETALDLENRHIALVEQVRKQVSIPIAVKLSPFYTALPNFAQKLVEAGADGLVLFNRFYQPDFDLEELEVVPNLVLSNSSELRLPLRWIAILHGRIQADLALTGGVHDAQDVIKAMMAGAKVVNVASALLMNGLGHVQEILTGMNAWMEEYEYDSIIQMQGSMSQLAAGEPNAFERANYAQVLSSY